MHGLHCTGKKILEIKTTSKIKGNYNSKVHKGSLLLSNYILKKLDCINKITVPGC